jgi:hypothetical protein
LHFGYHTTALATLALLNSAIFATLSGTLLANAFAVHCNFGLFAVEHVFEGHFEWVFERLHLLGALFTLTATTAAHAKHLTENVVHSAATATAFLKAVLSVLVVDISLLCVRESFMSLVNFLELLLVTTSVGMVLQSSLLESLFDLVHSRSFFNTKQVVILLSIDLFFGATTTLHSGIFSSHSTTHTAEGEPSAATAAAKEHVLV